MYGLAHGPENCANHESNEQVNALIAEENGQRFGVNGHVDLPWPRHNGLATKAGTSEISAVPTARFARLIASQPILCSLT
jgi:hypothetical protein